ncbi:class I SAM-dependent methyltransferase [Allosphingosinicella sp.]|uniref:class I SAM-dependent methyltransferase n=1 Tax=Allosphingosinicella sp. TaxID=2823234 RepID=UPI003782DB78
MVNTANRWSAADYAKNASFVPRLGDAVLNLLNPQPGELILDVGCGDGVLTERIVEAGASVIGLDSSEEMVEAARARGIDAFVADAEDMDVERFGAFDAVFSNAALHWMLDPDAVASGIFKALRGGGRFVGEMGGDGNLLTLRTALREELTARGYVMPDQDPSWYAGVDEFTRLYLTAGFSDIKAELIPRPTPLPGGAADWVKTFRAGVMDVAMVPEFERDDIAAAVEEVAPGRQPDAPVRLRFAMRKPG